MRGKWLFHPDSPGERVWVVRSTLGWLLKPRDFATLEEVEVYRLWCAANRLDQKGMSSAHS